MREFGNALRMKMRFNGAAPARGRKSELRPSQCAVRHFSFNGAAPARGRKCQQQRCARQLPAPLQRGRPRAGAEMFNTVSTIRGIPIASTGPPPRGGGNPCHWLSAFPSGCRLQRGRPRAGAEIPMAEVTPVQVNPASTGPPPRGGGNVAVALLAGLAFVASTGPPPRGGGNHVPHRHADRA